MPMYIDPDLIADETAVAEAILAGIADRLNAALDLEEGEDWQPQEGDPETHLAEAVGIILATGAALIQDKEREDYAGFGSLILNLQRTAAEPAIGYTTWTFTEAPPVGGSYLIPDGSELVMDAPDGTPIGFATVGDVIATGASETDVQVVAVEPGPKANGLLGDAREFEALPFVANVEMTTASDGGSDEQSAEDYLEVVARTARRMKIVPVITDDYADTAIDHPSVAAAVAVRLLNAEVYPATPASPGHVTVFTRDAAGNANTSGVKTEVIASMQGVDRPLGVTVHVQDPTYTALTLTVSIRVALDADIPTTTQAVKDALNLAFSKALFALDDDAPGRWRAPTTTSERTITAYDVAAVVTDVEGVTAVTAATVNGGASVVMSGWAPLPNLTGDPTVTVVT